MERRRFAGEALRRARTELGLSQEQAAARVGVDARTWRRYETGAVNEADGFSVRHAARRRLIDRMCRELGLEEGDLLRPLDSGQATPPPPPAADLPPPCAAPVERGHRLPRARHFLGREPVLAELLTWAAEPAPRERVRALVAAGGAGKTSLLAALLERLPEERPVFCWSCYDDPRGEALLLAAGRALGATSDAPPAEALLAALERHTPGPLLVVDGLEVLQAEGGGGRARGELLDPLLRRVLRGLASTPGRARLLVASRLELADLSGWEGDTTRTLRLPPLAGPDARALLAAWGVTGPDAELEAIASQLEGHALAVAVAGSYAAGFLGGRAAALREASLREAAADDPLARRLATLLSAYARELPPLERRVLAALAAFPGGLEDGALDALLIADGDDAVPPAQREAALARLERRGLVHRGAGGGVLHPFLGAWCREALVTGDPRRPHELEAARLERLLWGAHDGAAPAQDEQADRRAEALIEQALAADRPDDAHRVYSRVLGGYQRLGLQAGAMLRGARVLSGFARERDPLQLRADLSPDLRVAVSYDWALYAEALGELPLALRCLDAHEQAIEAARGRVHEPTARSTACRARAYVLRLQGLLPAALRAAEQATDQARRCGNELHLTRALAFQAVILHDLGREEDAARLFAQARAAEGGAPQARRALWLAEHLSTRAPLEARLLAEQVAEETGDLGWTGHVAQACALLGRLELLAAPPGAEAARDHLDVARAWAAQSGEVEAQLRAGLLGLRLALADGDLVAAARETAASASLIETSGARWFSAELGALEARLLLARGRAAEARQRATAAVVEATAPDRGHHQAAREARALLAE